MRTHPRDRMVFLIVLDSVGIGAAPDAADFGDSGANTLLHTAEAVGGLQLDFMRRLGLGNIPGLIRPGSEIRGVGPAEKPLAAFGALRERSRGKDTTTGHWEMAGLELEEGFRVFPAENSFPRELIAALENETGRRVIGNKAASGTEIIAELGEEHVRTGRPIVYTSADSVFQIAAHEDVAPRETLYGWCETARELLTGEHGVCRVIARPFIGEPGAFTRTSGRRDYSLEPFGPTVLDAIQEAGMDVFGVGKIDDVFANRGITECVHTVSNADGMARILEYVRRPFDGLLFANLVETDMLWGHRNDPRGYADALEAFDAWLPRLLEEAPEDLLIITADHGVDPTTASTDHSREYAPVLCAHPGGRTGDLATRATFADAAATVAQWLGVEFACDAAPFWEDA